MSEVYIHGVGTSFFGLREGNSFGRLAWEAISEALEDAGDGPIDAVFASNVLSSNANVQGALRIAGLAGIPVFTVEAACASGSIAFEQSVRAVESGAFERVLALGIEQMSAFFTGAIHPEQTDADGATGLALPGHYAMAASKYLADGLVTERQLAAVAVKNRRNALHNDRAQYAGEYTIEEVLSARMIADPFTLLQCCPVSDGAAAAVVGGKRTGSGQVRVRGVARGSGGLWDHRTEDVWGYRLIQDTATRAWEAAQLGTVDDIDVLEVHDAFTISEIATYEALGLADKGDGGAAAELGVTAIGGKHPVNPSGGLLSRGHPLGATGMAQLTEIVWQLRGLGGGRQVDNARIGVVETMGGGTSGIDGNACVVTVLEGLHQP
ncbi:thiolase family protein [Mycobacterium syngnathidarum]